MCGSAAGPAACACPAGLRSPRPVAPAALPSRPLEGPGRAGARRCPAAGWAARAAAWAPRRAATTCAAAATAAACLSTPPRASAPRTCSKTRCPCLKGRMRLIRAACPGAPTPCAQCARECGTGAGQPAGCSQLALRGLRCLAGLPCACEYLAGRPTPSMKNGGCAYASYPTPPGAQVAHSLARGLQSPSTHNARTISSLGCKAARSPGPHARQRLARL